MSFLYSQDFNDELRESLRNKAILKRRMFLHLISSLFCNHGNFKSAILTNNGFLILNFSSLNFDYNLIESTVRYEFYNLTDRPFLKYITIKGEE